MPDRKVKFVIVSDSSATDSRSSVITVRAMQICGDEDWFLFPRENSALVTHPILAGNAAIKKAKNAIKKRGQHRTVAVNLSEEQLSSYFDDTDNPTWGDEILETVPFLPKDFNCEPPEIQTPIPVPNVSTPQTHVQPEQQSKPLQTIIKDVVLEKFNGKTPNARNWIKLFEHECSRIKVPADRYHEALRLFLEGPAEHWYTAMRITTMSNDWKFWKDSFAETFENKGWNDVMYAYSFIYKSGSVSDYALQKLKLIVEVEPLTSDSVKINLIVHGLPQWARTRLDRGEIDSVGKLLQKLNQFETTNTRFKSNNNSSTKQNPSSRWSNSASEPCGYCLKKKGMRHIHLESDCRIKKADEDRKRNNSNGNNKNEERKERPFRINSAEVTDILEKEQKNE